MVNKLIKSAALLTALTFLCASAIYNPHVVKAEEVEAQENETRIGGGYAVEGEIKGVGYMSHIYDANNGLPTSDANYILAASDGYIWIGGYSGIIRYDGARFERQDAADGLTSGRVIFEDSKKRLWVGTNDNGVVVLDGAKSIRYTYKEGLPSSSIRTFAEDGKGCIFIGSTNGVSYVDASDNLCTLDDERLNGEVVLRLVSDSNGVIYGNTKNGDVFSIVDGTVSSFYKSEDLGIEKVTTLFADPHDPGSVYLGTESNYIYYGKFGYHSRRMKKIPVAPASNIYWITYACDRIWITSENIAGYIDEFDAFHVLENVPMNNSIDMMTADYQGNLWFASSRQGVMKVVVNNFQNLTEEAGIVDETVNATCLYNDKLYVGTDNGLFVLDEKRKKIENDLTKHIGKTRIRCLEKDKNGNLWIATYTNNMGLICFSKSGEITDFTEKNGLLSDEIRCVKAAKDGSVLAGTNAGLAVIKDGKVVRTVGEADGVDNTVFLTVEEGEDGNIYAGTDGDGLYLIQDNKVLKLGREDGLTSDVILRVKKDETRGVYWIITSNSIEYIKGGTIFNIDTFPYNNNFDLYFDVHDNIWILSSYGVYAVSAKSMLDNNVTDYRLYSVANGLAGAPTANAYSEMTGDGDLYISTRAAACMVNVNHFFEQSSNIKVGIGSLTCNDEPVTKDESGAYIIPAVEGRIQITPSILNYAMTNPTVKVFLEGTKDPGITALQSNLSSLEYTGLAYGDYVLHVQILDGSTMEVCQDETFNIVKKPKIMELLAVRIILLALLALIVGLIVWRVMTGTVIRRQYEEIRQAKEEAERANSAKTRFLANMSHEIRTPINTIMGMDEMIIREDSTDVPKSYSSTVVNYAMDIRNASESLLGLVNDLLDMSKIESGKMHLVEQEYDVQELLRSIVSMVRVRSEEKKLTFDVIVDETMPTRLYGDAGKIKQIVLNLLTNAIKYTEVGGFSLDVVVESRTEDKCSLKISVKDTGIGVKPEDMDKLFAAYERLEEEKNADIQGTGLGLDISRRFATLMGGELTCESEYGEGSEFIFTFVQKIEDNRPLGKFIEKDNRPKGPYVPQFVAPDAEVLLVDDNPMNLTVIKGLLKPTRIFVTTAESGEECLAKLKYGTFNVVLLDHMMPGMDGVETLERIRETMPDLPVYALTANSTAGEEFYKSKGFNGYIPKPVDSVVLEKAIMRHLPEEIMMKPKAEDVEQEPTELPDDMKWVNKVDDLSVDDGIRNSGGISQYCYSLKMFHDTIDASSEVIENAFDKDDIRLFTVKVHALKSSARIIGAQKLSKLAEELEAAGNGNDLDFIKKNTKKLLDDLRAYKEKLSRIVKDNESDKALIPDEELNDAYAALKEVVPQMDYDAVEMIIEQLKEYNLPQADKDRIDKLESMLKSFNWDGMEELIKEIER
ncbi:MAG: response regulator [Lachnospiraceae bacterium]|jgi:signal transduction histidine kinase/ligand-binding sensor domain-containing protein/response regulator of citrate/malate metabolism/HPt (histidine-containing phosphotransfer) domain-containing protein|nr:response regulator [Lachnospiraceae bacterium]